MTMSNLTSPLICQTSGSDLYVIYLPPTWPQGMIFKVSVLSAPAGHVANTTTLPSWAIGAFPAAQTIFVGDKVRSIRRYAGNGVVCTVRSPPGQEPWASSY